MDTALRISLCGGPHRLRRGQLFGHLLFWLFWLAILLCTTGCLVAYVAQERLIFPNHLANRWVTKGPSRPDIERLWLTTDDECRVEAWFIPGRGCTPAAPGPAVVYLHGNGELIDRCPRRLVPYRDMGVSVLLPEYRGYGRSGGKPSQKAIVADVSRFYDLLVARPEVDRTRVFAHGLSLGGGVAAQLAAQRDVAALILESTFVSVAEFARSFLLPESMCRHPFRTDRALESFRGPVLIFHGRRDGIIPVRHGRRLHALIPQSTYIELNAGHNDMRRHRDRIWDTIRNLVSHLKAPRQVPARP